MTKILVLGDIFGRPGRRLVRELLPTLVSRHGIDLVVANGENAAGGIGITCKAADELFGYGIDVLTSGNHIFKHKEIYGYMETGKNLLRPANYPAAVPGSGSVVVRTGDGTRVGIVNLLGRTFMAPVDCPFRVIDEELAMLAKEGARIVVVDIHAEATSEKKALGWHVDGKVGAVLGTHTHVQTADEGILPQGTAYMSDLGMTGPHESVIGMKPEGVMANFITRMPSRFEAAKKGLRLEGVVVEIDPVSGLALKIERIQQVM